MFMFGCVLYVCTCVHRLNKNILNNTIKANAPREMTQCSIDTTPPSMVNANQQNYEKTKKTFRLHDIYLLCARYDKKKGSITYADIHKQLRTI